MWDFEPQTLQRSFMTASNWRLRSVPVRPWSTSSMFEASMSMAFGSRKARAEEPAEDEDEDEGALPC